MTQVAGLAVVTAREDYTRESEDVRQILVAQWTEGCTLCVLVAWLKTLITVYIYSSGFSVLASCSFIWAIGCTDRECYVFLTYTHNTKGQL